MKKSTIYKLSNCNIVAGLKQEEKYENMGSGTYIVPPWLSY
jgi:hypothetical protein